MQIGKDYVGVSTPFYCHDGNGNFLFAKRGKNCRDEHGSWDCGSGKLEFGLTPEENVLAEVKEEYGCEGKIVGRLPPHSIIRELDGVKTHWLAVPFFIQLERSEARNNEPHKFDEIGWFRLDNLPKPLHKGFSHSLETYRPEFEKFC